MELEEKLEMSINNLIIHFKNRNIHISTNSYIEIENWIKRKNISLPFDFIKLYSKINGMDIFYPNDMDDEGFLLYPLEAIISTKSEFSNYRLEDNTFIFAEFMHKSWWYGFKILDKNKYVIGIIPMQGEFKPLTDSLAEFIELYITNSSKLYDYL